MVAASQALLYFIAQAEAVLAFRTMRIVRLDAIKALTALIAHIIFAGSAVLAVLIVVPNALVAQLMLFAAAIKGICFFAIYDKTYTAILATQVYAIWAMLI